MNRRSRVGTWLGKPSHSRNRFSNMLAVWMNGILKWSPGSVMGSPTGSPNWVMTTWLVSLTM